MFRSGSRSVTRHHLNLRDEILSAFLETVVLIEARGGGGQQDCVALDRISGGADFGAVEANAVLWRGRARGGEAVCSE